MWLVFISQAIFMCVHRDTSQHVLPLIWARTLLSSPALLPSRSDHSMVGESDKQCYSIDLPCLFGLALLVWTLALTLFQILTNLEDWSQREEIKQMENDSTSIKMTKAVSWCYRPCLGTEKNNILILGNVYVMIFLFLFCFILFLF